MIGYFTDYHCHVLPDMDDGAKDVDESLSMLNMLRDQGVERVVATPHFYPNHMTLDKFLVKRKNRFDLLQSTKKVPIWMVLGSEVQIKRNISGIDGIEKLTMGDRNVMLFEMPFEDYDHWIGDEICNIAFEYHITPILAHLERYLGVMENNDIVDLLSLANFVVQINYESVNDKNAMELVKYLLDENIPLIFGSDSHNTTSRKPNVEESLLVLRKKVGQNTLKKIIEYNQLYFS